MCCITKSAKMNGTALSLIARAWHRHEMAPATQHSDAGPLQSHRLLEKFNYTKEQEMLVDRMGPRVRAIHRSGNVSHFHESWMECAIVGRLSLSLWATPPHPPLLPPPPWLLLLPLLSYWDCVSPNACSYLFASVWVRTIPGPAWQQHLRLSKGRKIEKRSPPFHPFNVWTVRFLQRDSTAMPSVVWNDISVVMATIVTH